MAESQNKEKIAVATGDGNSFFEDLQSPSFRIAQEEKSNILKEEIQIDDELKIRLETCIQKCTGRAIKISECTSYIAASTRAQELVFANQFFAIVARFYDYARALNEYTSFLENNRKEYVECEPNAFAGKKQAEKECAVRIEKLLAASSLSELDQKKFKKFVSDKAYRMGKDPINYEMIKEGANRGKFKISCRKDVLGSCLLGLLEIPNASSGCIGIIVDSLVQNMKLFGDLKDKLLKKQKKTEIYRNESAVDFYKQVLLNTFEYDKGLSKIEGVRDEKSGFWKIDGYNIGRDVSKKDRLSNYSTDIKWRTNTGTYCAYLEIEIDPMVNIFFAAYNKSYEGKFFLACEGKNFVMYEYESSSCDVSSLPKANSFRKPLQQIFYGAPGTGKSYIINKGPLDVERGIHDGVEKKCVFRTTFHPDYDYAQFVGTYKPQEKSNVGYEGFTTKCLAVNNITYCFSPQVFAQAYLTAWKKYFDTKINSIEEKNVYLVIEEINRGNCAQIFGDLFQLLDRDENGFSRYSIAADKDFGSWFVKEMGRKLILFYNYIVNRTQMQDSFVNLMLPPNLNILATMNTSDQSLFPMDSAFKRRFDWKYVPISFENQDDTEKECAKYEIDVLDSKGNRYLWKNFVETVNEKILTLTESEDKQLGEFFIKPDNGNVISKDRFLGKVMFYLWNEVCKDEHKNGSFFRTKDGDKEKYFTFQDLYRNKDLLKQFMDELLNGKP